MVGASAHWGKDVSTVDVRAHAGYVYSADGTGEQRFFLGFGGTAAYGALGVKDPRGIDGVVGASRWFVGPEFRLGTSWIDKEPHRATDVYLAFAPLYVHASGPSDRVPERDGAFGTRAALGLAVVRSYPTLDLIEEPKSCDGGLCGIALFLLLLPNTIEASWESAAGSHRGGVVVGYTF